MPILINASIIRDEENRVNLIQATVYNISQRKSYEKELLIAKQKADELSKQILEHNDELKTYTALVLEQKKTLEVLNKRLERKNKQLSDFAHILSHNLRSPVFNLHTLLDFYNESTDPDYKASMVDTIADVANEMETTLNELVDALKVQEDFKTTTETLYFDTVLRTIQTMVSGDIKATKAKITSNFTAVNQIAYSSVYLKSAMLNLLSNALKYRAAKRTPEIHFETSITKEYIVLSVTDNGIGIDMDKHRNDLFGLNKTFHNHQNSKGLGLYMTRIQIEAMGGKISAESVLDKGTTFKIMFKKGL